MDTPRLLAILLGLALFGGATVALGWIGTRAHLSRRWPRVPGVIAVSKLEDSGRSRLRGRVHVAYRYNVGGVEHTGTRVRFGDWLIYSGPVAREIAVRYPAGRRVTVLHHPRNLADATLEPAATTILYVWLGIAAFGLGAILASLL
jgi:hypothetical protein